MKGGSNCLQKSNKIITKALKSLDFYHKNSHIKDENMKIIKVTKEYFETEDEKVYFFEPLKKKISVKDMQKIVNTNRDLVEKSKNG